MCLNCKTEEHEVENLRYHTQSKGLDRFQNFSLQYQPITTVNIFNNLVFNMLTHSVPRKSFMFLR